MAAMLLVISCNISMWSYDISMWGNDISIWRYNISFPDMVKMLMVIKGMIFSCEVAMFPCEVTMFPFDVMIFPCTIFGWYGSDVDGDKAQVHQRERGLFSVKTGREGLRQHKWWNISFKLHLGTTKHIQPLNLYSKWFFPFISVCIFYICIDETALKSEKPALKCIEQTQLTIALIFKFKFVFCFEFVLFPVRAFLLCQHKWWNISFKVGLHQPQPTGHLYRSEEMQQKYRRPEISIQFKTRQSVANFTELHLFFVLFIKKRVEIYLW